MTNIEGLMKVNVRVRSMKKAMEFLQNVLGAEPMHDRGSDTIGDFNGATVKLGNLVLDVMAPNDPEGALARSIDKRGEGLDSICLQVKSFDDVEKSLAEHGIELVNKHVLHGNKVGFIHPRDALGMVIELIEPRSGD